MDFKTWWAKPAGARYASQEGTIERREGPRPPEGGQQLLVISDEDSDKWLRVYDPGRPMQGYVDWPHLSVIPEPPDAEAGPDSHAGFPAGLPNGLPW